VYPLRPNGWSSQCARRDDDCYDQPNELAQSGWQCGPTMTDRQMWTIGARIKVTLHSVSAVIAIAFSGAANSQLPDVSASRRQLTLMRGFWPFRFGLLQVAGHCREWGIEAAFFCEFNQILEVAHLNFQCNEHLFFIPSCHCCLPTASTLEFIPSLFFYL
jgi:hypothetical protein